MSHLADAINRGIERYHAALKAKEEAIRERKAAKEKIIQAGIPKAKEWVEKVLPSLIEDEAAKGGNKISFTDSERASGDFLDTPDINYKSMLRVLNKYEDVRVWTTQRTDLDLHRKEISVTDYHIAWDNEHGIET